MHNTAQAPMAGRAGRRLGLRTTQLLPDQALLHVGARSGCVYTTVNAMSITFIGAGVDGRRREGDGHQRPDDLPAHRRAALELPLDDLRHPLGDGELGAVGGDDRVHLHEPVEPGHPPARHGHLRGHLRHRCGRWSSSASAISLFDLDLSNANYWGALVILAVCSISLVGFGIVAAVMPLLSPEKGQQVTLHRLGPAAARLRRLLPGRGAPGLDAGDRHSLPGHLRARRIPRGAPARRRRRSRALGQHLAAPDHGRGLRAHWVSSSSTSARATPSAPVSSRGAGEGGFRYQVLKPDA